MHIEDQTTIPQAQSCANEPDPIIVDSVPEKNDFTPKLIFFTQVFHHFLLLGTLTYLHLQQLREAVRREKGLSVISSLLRMSNDSVVRSIAVCLRNLASDSKNKELLG